MRHNISRTIELCANVAIIAVAIAIVAVLVRRYVLPPSPPVQTEQRSSGPVKDTRLDVNGVDWSQSGTTLVLALQKGCHFCSESAGFYQRLAQLASEQKSFRLLAVLPQSTDEAKGYLDSLKVPISDIRQSSLEQLGVSGTPTLILVDKQGTIKESWVGRLSPDREGEVVRSLQSAQQN